MDLGRRRNAFIGYDEEAIWLEKNDAVEWKLPWKELSGIQTSYSSGAMSMAVGCSLLGNGDKTYPLPVHWLTRYPPELKGLFEHILSRIPEGRKPGGSSCPIPTRAGAYRVLGIGALLTAFGLPVVVHFMPSSQYEQGDWIMLLTQTNSLMGGVGVLFLGAIYLLRARRASGSRPTDG